MFKKRGVFYEDDFDIVKKFCVDKRIEKVMLVVCLTPVRKKDEEEYFYTEKPKKIQDMDIDETIESCGLSTISSDDFFIIFWEENIELEIDLTKYPFKKISDINNLKKKFILYSEQFINGESLNKGSVIFQKMKREIEERKEDKIKRKGSASNIPILEGTNVEDPYAEINNPDYIFFNSLYKTEQNIFFKILLEKKYKFNSPEDKEKFQFINNLKKFKVSKHYNKDGSLNTTSKYTNKYFMNQVNILKLSSIFSIIEKKEHDECREHKKCKECNEYKKCNESKELKLFKQYLKLNPEIMQIYLYIKIIYDIRRYVKDFKITNLKKLILKPESKLGKYDLLKGDLKEWNELAGKIKIDESLFFKKNEDKEYQKSTISKYLNFDMKATLEFFSVAIYCIENHIDLQSKKLEQINNIRIQKNMDFLLSKSKISLKNIEQNIKKYKEQDRLSDLRNFQDYKILLNKPNKYTICNIKYNDVNVSGYKFKEKMVKDVVNKDILCLIKDRNEIFIVKLIEKNEDIYIKSDVIIKQDLTLGSLVKVVTELRFN